MANSFYPCQAFYFIHLLFILLRQCIRQIRGAFFSSFGWFQDNIPIDWSGVEDQHGILEMYRDLKRNLSGVTRGLCGQNVQIYHFDDRAKTIAYHRWDKQGLTDSVVVVNMTNQNRDGYAIGFPRFGLWKTKFNSDSYNYGPNYANHPTSDVEVTEDKFDGMPCSGKIGIGPYTMVIFSQDQ
jgi:1,4-alpha-glucan branching enzyme